MNDTTTVIPQELKTTDQWLCYKLIDKGNGKFGKPPVNPKTGYPCAKNDPTKFVSFDEAVLAADSLNLDGIGFVLANGWVAIDLDGCLTDGSPSPLAAEILKGFPGAYVEVSPSGTGLHIFVRGEKRTTRSRDTRLGIECYEGFNFMTVTGVPFGDMPKGGWRVDQQSELDEFCETYLGEIEPAKSVEIITQPDDVRSPEEWLTRGLRADGTFSSLYNGDRPNGDESSDDFALLGKLAYWLNGDRDQMERVFLGSPHFRSKDTKHQAKVAERKDYLPRSIDRVLGSLRSTAAMDDAQYVEQMARRIEIHFENHNHTLDDLTDIGNATLMAEVFGDRLRYTSEFGWCFWNGQVWELNKNWRALEAAKEIADTLLGRATEEMMRVRKELEQEGIVGKALADDIRFKAVDKLLKHANQSRNVNRLKAMVEISTALLHSEANEFDTDPWLLNTPGGMVDLRSCEVLPHDPKSMMTACTTTTPDFDTPAPQFTSFLNLISNGRTEWVDYLQRLVGSALVGKVYAENLVIATGRGANGKSTVFNIIRFLTGDYGTSVDPNLLMSRQASEQQVGISMVHRKRLAIAQETEEGQRLSASMLKKLCSTDPKVGKRLYRDPVEFVPTHTLILSTNHLPKVISNDEGTWRRIAVLPFDAVIPEGERITDYHTHLLEQEGAAILAWMVKGAEMFSKAGCALESPECVRAASVDYRHKEDWLSNFLNECCVVHNEIDRLGARHSDLYGVYTQWAIDNGEYKRSSREFAKLLEGQGFHAFDNKRVGSWVGKVWVSLDLNDDHKPEPRRTMTN